MPIWRTARASSGEVDRPVVPLNPFNWLIRRELRALADWLAEREVEKS